MSSLKARRVISLIIGICLVASVLYIITLNRNTWNFGKNVNLGGEALIYSLEGGVARKFQTDNDNLIVLDNTKIFSINKHGEKLFEFAFASRVPVLKRLGQFILVYDKESCNLMLINKNKVQYETVVTSPILAASVNKNGYVSIISEETGYKCKVECLKPTGEVFYSWLMSEYYANDSVIMDNNSTLVVSLISSDEKDIIGSLAFVDTKAQTLIEQPAWSNCIFTNIFCQKGNILAVSDVALMMFSPVGVQKWQMNYDSRYLQNFAILDNKYIYLLFENSINTSSMEIVNMNGKTKSSMKLDFVVEQVDVANNTVACSGMRDIIFCSLRGKKQTSLEFQSDIRWMGLTKHGRELYVVHGTDIELIRP